MAWRKPPNSLPADGFSTKIPGIDHPCLLRTSLRIYQLLDPKKPEHSDVQTFDAGQMKQFVLFDRHLRSIDHSQTAALAVPSGYRDLASLFNKYNNGRERFATYERRQDGSLEVCTDGTPVKWHLFKIASSLVDGWSGSELGVCDQEDDIQHQDGADQVKPEEFSDDNSYVMVERTENAELLHDLCERVKGTVDVIKEINHFYHARADIEREYSARLAELSKIVSARHATGELLASLEVLRRETATQSSIHSTLLADITRDLRLPCEAVIEKSSPEIREILASAHQKFPDIDRQSLGNSDSSNQKQSIQISEEWAPLVEECQKLEEAHLELLKDTLWAYANLISTACVADDESSENIRVALEKFEPIEEAQNFASAFGGTTNTIPEPLADSDDVLPAVPTAFIAASVPTNAVLPPECQVLDPTKYMFYVKALYDFEAIEVGDMTLTAGDFIGVVLTPEDGWWQGELLSGSRKHSGSLRFPCNFVTT